MREISPATNVSADAYFKKLPPQLQVLVTAIRDEKRSGTRRRPSQALIDKASLHSATKRAALVDRVAALVDENLAGRSEMCEQFASLLALGLIHLGLSAQAIGGEAIYFAEDGSEVFRWQHAWVRIGDEVIDGNTDSLIENPVVPKLVSAPPYWGPIKSTPRDRKLRGQSVLSHTDPDVATIWWPELKLWLDTDFQKL